MSRSGGFLGGLVALSLGLGMISAAASDDPAPVTLAAAEAMAAPRFAPSPAVTGEPVRATGRLSTRVVRQVVLQRRTPSLRWRRVLTGKTTAVGRYRLRFTAPTAATRYRVVAPAFERPAKRYPRLVTDAARLKVTVAPTPTPTPTSTPMPVSVQLEVPAHALAAGPRPSAVIRTTGLPGGTAATVERRTGTTWQPVATAALDRADQVSLALPLDDLGPGAATLRAVAGGVASAPQPIDVAPPATVTAPADDEAFGGPFDVQVDVDPALTATRVRLFLDGFVLPVEAGPVAGEPGRWAAMVDPASAAITRRHVDVTAKVTTADGVALTDPVRVDLLPSTGGLPPGFRSDTVAAGFDLPTSFAPLDDHRLLVAEKGGLVRLAVDGVVATTPVLDLRETVADHMDAGILDVAPDPDFVANGWFYLSYVVDDAGPDRFSSQRVVRYTLDGDVADPGSAHVVLGSVPLATCVADASTPGCLMGRDGMHTVDDLLFDQGGALLVSVGDSAPGDPARAVVAQRLDVLAGKVLRIDPVTGLGLPDNPYYELGQPASNRSRVWAYGFRNPFRMAMAPDGGLYVGDVGEVAFEEVDEVVAGGNYGWPCFEGEIAGTAPAGDPDCVAVRSGAVEHRTPLRAYQHVDFAGSVTLGVFEDGTAYPAEYAGRLFLGDYTQGRIWTLDVVDPEQLEDFGTPPGLGAAVAFAIGPDSDVWYADIASGSIRRLVYDPDDQGCPSGQFLAETFRNRLFEPEDDGRPWVSSCVGTPPAGPSLVAPGSPNQGDGWSMRWSGTPQLAPGTYQLTAQASGTIEVVVDGIPVPDGGTFTVAGTDVNEASAQVVVELRNNPDFDDDPFLVDFDWNYLLSWTRVGSAPVVTLNDLGQGGRVLPGSTVGWTVSAQDAEDGTLGADRLRVTVTLLHYGSGSPHRHPAGSFDGTSGSFAVDDGHAPGRIAYRLVGIATDSSGWVAESDPVYVCLVGGDVGPCS